MGLQLNMPQKRKLADLEITNGEFANLQSLTHFLQFMKREKIEIPKNAKELNDLFTQYVIYVRREDMNYISEMRVARGESPLPKRMLR